MGAGRGRTIARVGLPLLLKVLAVARRWRRAGPGSSSRRSGRRIVSLVHRLRSLAGPTRLCTLLERSVRARNGDSRPRRDGLDVSRSRIAVARPRERGRRVGRLLGLHSSESPATTEASWKGRGDELATRASERFPSLSLLDRLRSPGEHHRRTAGGRYRCVQRIGWQTNRSTRLNVVRLASVPRHDQQ